MERYEGPVPLDARPTAELVKEALAEARELVQLEVKLAKEEMRVEIKQAKKAGIAVGVSGVVALLGLSTLVVALVLALGGTALAALIVAIVLLAMAGGGAAFAYSRVPKDPLDSTRRRLEADVNQLKEHVV
jgi:uncharacterized membrane protein YqjE